MQKTKNDKTERSFGDVFRDLRTSHKHTQEYVAAILGVSRQAVSKWERSISEPSTHNILEIAKIYKLTADELLKSTSVNKTKKKKLYRSNLKRNLKIIGVIAVILLIVALVVLLIHNQIYFSKLISTTNVELAEFVEDNPDIEFVQSPASAEIDTADDFWQISDILTFNIDYIDEKVKFEGVLADDSGKLRIIGLEFEDTEKASKAFLKTFTWRDGREDVIYKSPWIFGSSKYAEHYWQNTYVYSWYDQNEFVVILAETRESGDAMKQRLLNYLN